MFRHQEGKAGGGGGLLCRPAYTEGHGVCTWKEGIEATVSVTIGICYESGQGVVGGILIFSSSVKYYYIRNATETYFRRHGEPCFTQVISTSFKCNLMGFDRGIWFCNHQHDYRTEHFPYLPTFFCTPLRSVSSSQALIPGSHWLAFCFCSFIQAIFAMFHYSIGYEGLGASVKDPRHVLSKQSVFLVKPVPWQLVSVPCMWPLPIQSHWTPPPPPTRPFPLAWESTLFSEVTSLSQTHTSVFLGQLS